VYNGEGHSSVNRTASVGQGREALQPLGVVADGHEEHGLPHLLGDCDGISVQKFSFNTGSCDMPLLCCVLGFSWHQIMCGHLCVMSVT
jgi:hypothetical protein